MGLALSDCKSWHCCRDVEPPCVERIAEGSQQDRVVLSFGGHDKPETQASEVYRPRVKLTRLRCELVVERIRFYSYNMGNS